MRYVEDCLHQRIIKRPSKGPYGEQGKDFTAVEDEDKKEYCSYVIKQGNLNHNLKGKYGILKQMDDAMFIDLEEKEFHGKKRTVVVVYNSDDGYRGSSNEFEKSKTEIENKAQTKGILLRNIERWDLATFTKKLFPFCKELLMKEQFENKINQMIDSMKFAASFMAGYADLKTPWSLSIKVSRFSRLW